jgi:hypothetical protein
MQDMMFRLGNIGDHTYLREQLLTGVQLDGPAQIL